LFLAFMASSSFCAYPSIGALDLHARLPQHLGLRVELLALHFILDIGFASSELLLDARQFISLVCRRTRQFCRSQGVCSCSFRSDSARSAASRAPTSIVSEEAFIPTDRFHLEKGIAAVPFPVLQLFVPMLHVFAELAFEKFDFSFCILLKKLKRLSLRIPEAWPRHRSFPKIANAFQLLFKTCSWILLRFFLGDRDDPVLPWEAFFGVTGVPASVPWAKQGPISYSTSSERVRERLS